MDKKRHSLAHHRIRPGYSPHRVHQETINQVQVEACQWRPRGANQHSKTCSLKFTILKRAPHQIKLKKALYTVQSGTLSKFKSRRGEEFKHLWRKYQTYLKVPHNMKKASQEHRNQLLQYFRRQRSLFLYRKWSNSFHNHLSGTNSCATVPVNLYPWEALWVVDSTLLKFPRWTLQDVTAATLKREVR